MLEQDQVDRDASCRSVKVSHTASNSPKPMSNAYTFLSPVNVTPMTPIAMGIK